MTFFIFLSEHNFQSAVKMTDRTFPDFNPQCNKYTLLHISLASGRFEWQTVENLKWWTFSTRLLMRDH